MARAKKLQKSESEKAWEAYFAIQLTPEQKAEARAEAEKGAAVARAAGAYERLLALRGKVKFKYTWDELRRMDDD